MRRAWRSLATGVAVAVGVFGFGLASLRADWFIRGDTNSNGTVNISDAIEVLRHLFAGASAPSCSDAADFNDDGKLDVSDATTLLGYLFLKQPGPVSPISGCWYDQTEDQLGCERSPACASLGMFFVTQTSGSFSGSLTRAKAEMLKVIQRLSETDQVGMAFFDAQLIRFPASGQPADMTPAMKEAAIAFVTSTTSDSGTCAKPAAFAALTYAAQSTAGRKQLLYFANGFNTCPGHDAATYSNEILAEVTDRNTSLLPIHAFCVGARGNVNEAWMKKLASQNGGSFVRIIP